MQHDDGVLLHGGHAGDQVVLAVGQAHMPPVRGGSLVKAVGQAGKNDGDVRGFGGGHGPQELRLVALVAVRGEALDIDGRCGRSGSRRRWRLWPSCSRGDDRRLNSAGGRRTRRCRLPSAPCAAAAHPDCAAARRSASPARRPAAVRGAVTVHGGRLGRCGRKRTYNVQNAGHGLLKRRLIQCAGLHGIDDFAVVPPPDRGIPVQPAATSGPGLHRARSAMHRSRQSPTRPQRVGQQRPCSRSAGRR